VTKFNPPLTSIQLVLPVHNEELTISGVLDEIVDVFDANLNENCRWKVVLSEDGSTDRTRSILESYEQKRPEHFVLLAPSPTRLGYSKAVIRGMLSITEQSTVCAMDSDGQCDPRDVLAIAKLALPNTQIGVGYRSPRIDAKSRLIYSSLFKAVYNCLFHVPLRDPSCPVIAISTSDIPKVVPDSPYLDFGYWWEFQARVKAAGLIQIELPVSHRARTDGSTRVYHLKKLPKIAGTHLFGLLKLQKEIRHSSNRS
jgi:glycosyltransferase involved in cell wall biosynthesis